MTARAVRVSANYRITECSGLEGTSVGHLVQPSRQSRVTYRRPQRTLSRRVLNISREGDSTTSLGSLLVRGIFTELNLTERKENKFF